jgi:hypothetical protein
MTIEVMGQRDIECRDLVERGRIRIKGRPQRSDRLLERAISKRHHRESHRTRMRNGPYERAVSSDVCGDEGFPATEQSPQLLDGHGGRIDQL